MRCAPRRASACTRSLRSLLPRGAGAWEFRVRCPARFAAALAFCIYVAVKQKNTEIFSEAISVFFCTHERSEFHFSHFLEYTFVMARATYMDIPDELKNVQRRAVQQRDRFFLGAVQSQRRELSRAKKALLRRTASIHSPQQGRGSMFKFLSPYWRALTTDQKNVWKAAAAYSSINGWQLFISDNAQRFKNSLTFPVPPSTLWQVRAGRLVIQDPASEIILKQQHPQSYLVTQKIPGTPWKKQIVTLNESFGFPLTLAIRYKSDLTPYGDTQVARYYAKIHTSYQSRDIYTDFEIPFSASADWNLQSLVIDAVYGIFIDYTLFLEISGYRGEVLFDNIRAVHGGTNWARDPRCDEIDKTFKKAFALVPPFWVPVSLPSGASFYSIFPPVLE